jgi:hypothetical protein
LVDSAPFKVKTEDDLKHVRKDLDKSL